MMNVTLLHAEYCYLFININILEFWHAQREEGHAKPVETGVMQRQETLKTAEKPLEKRQGRILSKNLQRKHGPAYILISDL